MRLNLPSNGKWFLIKRIWLAWALVRAAIFVAGCGAGTVQSAPPSNPPSSSGVTVNVTPPTANLRAGDTFSFQASVSGSSNTNVTWSVNGTSGGSSSVGTIDANGKYTAPASLPNPNTI